MEKEKCDEILPIEAGNVANSKLLASFPTKSRGISAIFTRHLFRAKVSNILFALKNTPFQYIDYCDGLGVK